MLRWFSLIFFQILDVASMTLFLMTMDCGYFGVPPSQIGINQQFNVGECLPGAGARARPPALPRLRELTPALPAPPLQPAGPCRT